jgi:aryl-alcohol dehydrogenase-like predicted oxidoreductase
MPSLQQSLASEKDHLLYRTLPYSTVQIDEAVTRSLTKLQTSYVDLLQVMLYNLIQEFTQHH